MLQRVRGVLNVYMEHSLITIVFILLIIVVARLDGQDNSVIIARPDTITRVLLEPVFSVLPVNFGTGLLVRIVYMVVQHQMEQPITVIVVLETVALIVVS